MSNPLVHFQPTGTKVEAKKDSSLLDLARDSGAAIESICSSLGKCGKCKVIVRSGGKALGKATESEKRILDKRELKEGVRLACQARVTSPANITVEVPEESRRGHHRLLASGIERKIDLLPAMRKYVLKIPPATLHDLRADDDRLLQVLKIKVKRQLEVSPGVHRHLPEALRNSSWTTTVTLFRDKEIVRAEPGDTSARLFGIAADIGTTKVVAYLLDLRTGEVLGNESMPNPQIPFGEDLMSRIAYTNKNPKGLEELQRVVAHGLNTLIFKLCADRGLIPDDILEVMVVGNTAMHHIFFGIPTTHLAAAPYAPAVRTSLSVNPPHVGLNTYPFGKVSSLPNIAGFVGADAVADLLSSRLYDNREIGMMIDIGTNTEIIVGNKERLVSCSCASGPAFEGAHIKFGMRASTGAIERVWVDPASYDVRLRTIDDAQPRGICGSGIVDAVSELFRAGILEPSGKIIVSESNPRTRTTADGQAEFIIAQGKETISGYNISITQHDVQEIQLAKAAIFAGVSILMKRLRLKPSSLKNVYAAGAFGTYVDASSAINIGMYPDVPVDRIKFIGNAAGSGARMCLKSTRMRDLADKLSRKVEYIELAAESEFQKEFAQAMFLPHRDLSRFPSSKRTAPKRPASA
ncbi:MAG: ASKHA domain-containing protein [Euryarchaeota archaeon]|nr:ASKHA domain-containing protein [Euryarchaeota archaeon]